MTRKVQGWGGQPCEGSGLGGSPVKEGRGDE